MAENLEAKVEENQEQTEEKKAKKKKPNFSKPFIICGILLGFFAGAPFMNLGNYIFGLWGWIFGILAAWFLSKEYKYFQVAHGGMVGFFTGLIGSGIAMGIDIGLCLANISIYKLVPALAKVGNIMGFWIPERFSNAVVLPAWNDLQHVYRVAIAEGGNAVSPTMTLTGHAFFMVPLLSGTAILGGIIGWKLFAKEAPKKQFASPRRRRPAEDQKPKPEVAPDKVETTQDSNTEAPSGEENSAEEQNTDSNKQDE